MKRFAAQLLFVICSSAAAAPNNPPSPDHYGFDWFKPETTRCLKLTPALTARFRQCQLHDPGNAFGLDFPMRVCQSGPESEFMVYATRKQCQEALETMRANAP